MPSRHVYRVSPWRRAMLYGIWTVFAAPLMVGGLVTGEVALLVTAAIFTLIALPIFVWAVGTARLILTPGGIELRQAGGTLETPWSNVQTLHLARRAEGFILREPLQSRSAVRYATASQLVIRGAPLYEPLRRQLLAEQRFVPIEAFGYWFVHGDLRQTIERLAPGLVQEGEEAAATLGVQSPRMSTTRMIGVSATILAACAAGVLAAARPDVGPIVMRVVLWVLAPAMVLMGVGNGVSAASFFRQRRLGSGLLWTIVAVAQVLIALAFFRAIVEPR